MITSFNNEVYNMTGQMNALAVNTSNILNETEKLKVYIPKVMINIEKGEPVIKKLQTKGYSVFKNANKKPTLSSPILNEKNYFETNFNASSNVDDLNSTSINILNEINQSINELAIKNNLTGVNVNKKMNYYIKKDTELRVEFLNGKINRLAFTTMDKTKTKKDLE